ncbi:MAG TPA: homoserine dehydrogenase [Candidatus Faecivivens stercorigallinarum]|nr:homoserine dehydrogenase [Candidatus Faecivivens stercorigallinarum]
MVKVAVLGHGTVGSGVVELFTQNAKSIASRAGQEIEVKRILDIREFPELPYAEKFTKNFDDILNDPEITIVAEVMGGLSPAFEFTKSLLEHGKSVVTSNKELVATKGAELLQVAKAHNVNYFFEASVGGGIPIIRPMHQCLAANEITEVAGILNGTTNYILTKMIHEAVPFDQALSQAQKLGYAERNPAADVEGHDACRKICILASLAFGSHVYPDTVHTEGITGLTLQDVEYASNWGGVIKLIGRAKKQPDGKVIATVYPAFLAAHSQLAGIDDVFNGILIRGNATGDVVFYGRGAGKMPTASAVVADMIDISKANCTSKSLSWSDSDGHNVADYKTDPLQFYIRASLLDHAQTTVSDVMGGVTFLSRPEQPEDEIAFVTGQMTEKELESKLEVLGNLIKVQSMIRVLDY